MNKLIVTGKLLILSGLGSLAIAQDGDKVNFEKEIYPFLKTSCVECHRAPYIKEGRTRATKPKAGLRFDAAFGIVDGAKGDAVVVPGKPKESSILQRTLLAEDHDDFMPPAENKVDAKPLTDEQKKLLEKWIEQGADFGGWKGNEEGKPDDAKDTFEKKSE